MQRKVILALLLFQALYAGAQHPDKKEKSGASDRNDHPAADSAASKYRMTGSQLPVVRFVDSSGVEYTNASLSNNANLFIMMFNPACEHCQDMAIDLGKNIGLFKKSNVVLVAASTMKPYLEYFYNSTKVGNYPKIKVTLDSCDFINKCFAYNALPQINVYNADRKLIKIFIGIETVEGLKPYIQ